MLKRFLLNGTYDKQVDEKVVLSYFEGRGVLDHYEEATRRIGLWASEELVFRKCFPSQKTEILELGCGVGRISFSLWMLGYEKLTASDVSNKMVKRALNIQKERRSRDQFSSLLMQLNYHLKQFL